MNYLAHLFLSCNDEDLLIGNFITDSIRSNEVSQYSLAIQEGIQLHRQIDTYTDQHPMIRRGTHRLRAHHNKYAPVVIDILYDYLLANNWEKYSDISLDAFAQGIYAILERRMEELPQKLQRRLPGMIKGNWLQAYGTEEGLRYTFERMDLRTSFPSRFVDAVEHVQQDYASFNEEFNAFFPEIIQFVESQCGC